VVRSTAEDVESPTDIASKPMLGRDRFSYLLDADVVVGVFLVKVGAFDQLENFFGTDIGQQIIDAFALGGVPANRSDLCAAHPQFARQEISGGFNLLICIRVRIKGDDHAAAFPDNSVEVRYHALEVSSLAVWSGVLADRPAPIPNARQPKRQESGEARPEASETPEGERLEFSLCDDYRRGDRLQQLHTKNRNKVEHVLAAGR
jgi:hypothetical protein